MNFIELRYEFMTIVVLTYKGKEEDITSPGDQTAVNGHTGNYLFSIANQSGIKDR